MPANRAEWISGLYNRFYTSQHYEEWDPRFFEKYDLASFKAAWEKMNPDVYILTARTHNGFWFADVGLGGQHKRLKGIDQFKELSAQARRRNKPVVAYFSTIYDKALYDEHPEWRQVDPSGRPINEARGSWSKVVCPNSPYKEYLIAMTQALIAHCDVDSIFFDMVFFEAKPCYCVSCRRLFREKYDAELPEVENWDDPLYRKFVQFRFDTNALFVKEIHDAVKAANPEIATAVQYVLLKGSERLPGQSLALGRIPDYIYSDVYFRQGYLPMSVCTKATAAVSRYRPEIGIMTRPGSHNDTPNMKSLDHVRAEAFTVIANGGAIMYFDIMWADGTIHQAMWQRIRQVMDEVEQRRPWLGGATVRTAAVFYSEKSRIWYGRADVAERYDANFFGVCRALIEEHIPFDIIVSLDEASLKGYQAVVLPNAACMSEAEAEALRAYVRGGGGVVCTDRTSLWDESGAPLEEYRLADVLGLRHVGDTGTYTRVYSRYDTGSDIAKRLPSDGLVTSWGAVQKVELTTGEARATVVFPYTEPTGERFVNIMANPPSVPSRWPACVANRFGRGKAVYFGSGIDKDYLKLSFPELKWLVADAVRSVMAGEPKVSLAAPMSVELVAYEREGGKQMVAHLVNFQPEIGKDIVEGGEASRHQIQEILPVYDLELTVRMDGVRKVTQQPEGQELPFVKSGSAVRVKIPRLQCHSMIVLEK